MENYLQKMRRAGVAPARILFPGEDVDLTRFAVLACDQHTGEPEYWDEVEKIVGDAPSALRLMVPEPWIGRENAGLDAALAMERYVAEGILRPLGEGVMYVKRTTESGTRRGLLLCFDLEQYDYSPGSDRLLRATEETVTERLPARMEVRSQSPAEMPHALILTEDPDDLLMGLLDRETGALPPLYDFPLMLGGGRLAGWFLQDEETLDRIADVLLALKDRVRDGMLFAVGDGNHSLAAAKEHWERLKETLSPEETEDHPARFCLAELENVYEPALRFEAMNRLLIHVDPAQARKDLGLDGPDIPDLQQLQPRIDAWLEEHPEAELDYIHGKEECLRLGEREGCLAITWDEFPKETLFSGVIENGILQRKSFSMGSTHEKRYYLECRLIRR